MVSKKLNKEIKFSWWRRMFRFVTFQFPSQNIR